MCADAQGGDGTGLAVCIVCHVISGFPGWGKLLIDMFVLSGSVCCLLDAPIDGL